jgi:D-lyxose ketol-isomerase
MLCYINGVVICLAPGVVSWFWAGEVNAMTLLLR